MEGCVTPFPETTGQDEVAGAPWMPFPERLNAVPFRIYSGSIPGVSAEVYQEDNRLWKKHVNAYKRVNKIIDSGRYRNIMDMNAGLGSFAAAIQSPKLWVMNVMPTIAEKDTLGVIYERGLIGIYHDWCEAFSTYPRTYDLIHASDVFSLYKDKYAMHSEPPRPLNEVKMLLPLDQTEVDSIDPHGGIQLHCMWTSFKCNAEDILLEMDRILRPEGAVIFRDQVDVLKKVKKIAGEMRWKTKMVDNEDGPLASIKILFAVKKYWVAGENSTTSSQ
ncbi:hypothetical protein Pint_15212 [Pistacia integerrima]|uniref:Uncharacterized protein n=1 Tax=Pistacia integerrima TaxID=434235 RepID=A0ACC0ZGW4_9ROSI|nr:hypothetical protein Pint_15212 [Pistacia integerrima]